MSNPPSMETAAATWLLRLREDKLSEAEMAEWIEWCEASAENLRTFEHLQSLWRAAGENPPAPEIISHLLRSDPSPQETGCEERFGGRAQTDLTKAMVFRNSRTSIRWALAASLVLVIATAGLWVLNRSHLPSTTAVQATSIRKIAASDVVRTPTAQNQEGLLPDGSRVDLGARTVLDVDFSTTRRQLELKDGQAFFHVTRDRSRPFVVAVGKIQVVAIGTAFDVRRTASEIAVTVQEGTVEMIKAPGNSLTATAGYQLLFDPATGKTHKSLVDPVMATAWRSGRLEFAGDPLEVVIASINRYSARPIVLSDPALGKLTFTGTVFTASIDASLDAMEQVFPIDVQRGASETTLRRRR